MSKQIKKLKNRLMHKFFKSMKSNKSNKGQMSLLVGISQLQH